MPNPLKPGVKSRMKMLLEQHQQAMFQLHLSDFTKVQLILKVWWYVVFSSTTHEFLLMHNSLWKGIGILKSPVSLQLKSIFYSLVYIDGLVQYCSISIANAVLH